MCVLCGSPVWPSPPVVGPLRGPSLCVGPLWVGPSPVVILFPVASVPRLASRSCSRSRSVPLNSFLGEPDETDETEKEENKKMGGEAAGGASAETQRGGKQEQEGGKQNKVRDLAFTRYSHS